MFYHTQLHTHLCQTLIMQLSLIFNTEYTDFTFLHEFTFLRKILANVLLPP